MALVPDWMQLEIHDEGDVKDEMRGTFYDGRDLSKTARLLRFELPVPDSLVYSAIIIWYLLERGTSLLPIATRISLANIM
jgi:hypothetical protein